MRTVVKIFTEHRKPDLIAFIIDSGLPCCLRIPSDIIRFCLKIPHSVRATECPNVGESIFTHDPKGKVAEAYANLAREVIGLERKAQVRPRPYGVR